MENDYKSVLDKYIETLSAALLNIERDILAEITSYSYGIIVECDNNWCSHDVLLCFEHKCDGDRTYIDEFDNRYYHDSVKNIKYCVVCRSIMNPCANYNSKGIIFDIDQDLNKTHKAYQLCGCSNRLCFDDKHPKCSGCGVTFCPFVLNLLTCGADGCANLCPYGISCDAILHCFTYNMSIQFGNVVVVQRNKESK